MTYHYNELKQKITAYYNESGAKTLRDLNLNAMTVEDFIRAGLMKELSPTLRAVVEALPYSAQLPQKIIEKIEKKHQRALEWAIGKRFEKLRAVEEVEAPAAVSVVVEWHKSQTWGMNPRARVSAERVATYGSASGCGYDKESAAIASAFNANPEILRIIYDHAEAGGVFPYGVSTFAGLPSFEGGCGVSCFYSIFEACGYTFRQVASGKMFDVYEITRN